MRNLRFHLDFISPYAYLAWHGIHDLAARNGCTVETRPVLLAALLDAAGSKGPAEIPAKRAYTGKHVARLAHDLGIRLEPPPAHPFNPLLALRVATLPLEEDVRRRLVTALYAAVWGGGGGAESPEQVARVVASVGLDPGKILEAAQQPANKDRLRAATQELIEAGGFGVPTMIADGELFWGLDSFPHLERFLRGEDPVDAAWVARWQHLPASARRI
jgi:2-hydroxychromene-2-carboxylate isomerase